MLPLKHPLIWRIAGIALLLSILVMALLPYVGPSSGSRFFNIPISDKWLHGLTFCFLAVWFSGQYERASYWRIVVLLVGYGTLIELGQSLLPYRSAELGDVVADGLGIATGIVLATAGLGGWSQRIENLLERAVG